MTINKQEYKEDKITRGSRHINNKITIFRGKKKVEFMQVEIK